MPIKKLPQSELKIMKFIWKVDSKITSKDIILAMEQKYQWKQTTTLTILSRLVVKGFLNSKKVNKHTQYEILINKKDYLNVETREFFSNIHDSSIKSLLLSLHADDNISEKDILFIEEWLRSIK
ncbi:MULTISPECIES: BlaI/MecI/CopY family transcriptional regulator [unclassified Clostridioides]|uniref:BlaI/MecI/CopY family transcriptional regulator n=1 Tax=unclassified Clostridioides TaxID=2635829 RepID=UPI001D0C2F9D|nr:BlaI/MecI/CopY family transcriptional regulator [Clostridioides sp. ES-S-0001-03]MCC0681297.1 BlaI/MecI/CopY family transcriptional regulator [Clostridioides sp. ES-S-0005-03]MCC0704014.1 BlaI/MecI/CopY family transcriptional regulator [Clostridioides sp. ES-S-0049-02]MCC0705919.1 BlaI/MecI/CopY family transcriptional regulator [Clostridioides sp. ES-S-0190-01]UDN48178.1 BlaI/MecI/CopY family transcriptional regulator [Clostridioides sp. ES-S-0173-01]UDN57838.1 BlaI/MecI/CopY family transcr